MFASAQTATNGRCNLGTCHLPSPNGGHLWHPMSYSPETKLVYIPALELPFLYPLDPKFTPVKGVFNLGLDLLNYPALLAKYADEMPPAWGELKAWDPVQQKARWTVKHPGSFNGGVLSTAGGLVFQGTSDGRFAAYAADSGEKHWEITTNIGIGLNQQRVALIRIPHYQDVTVSGGANLTADPSRMFKAA